MQVSRRTLDSSMGIVTGDNASVLAWVRVWAAVPSRIPQIVRDTSAVPENSTQCHHRVTKGDPDQSMAATHGPPSLPPLPSRQRLPLTWPTLSRALHTSLQLCPQVSPEDEGACQSPWEPSLSCLLGGMTGANELEDIPPVGVCWGPGQVTLLSSAPWSSGPKHTPAPFLVRDMQGDRV